MTAYWVNTFTEIRDEERLRRYAELAGPAITAAGGRFLARGNPVHVFENGRLLRTAIIEFPSADAARAAYGSPAYQEALGALGDAATRDIRIVEGV
jgi:uncharacterized protein (DUF1330 family)